MALTAEPMTMAEEIPRAPRPQPAGSRCSTVSAKAAQPNDGTRALLKSGFWITLAALVSLLLTKTVLGGIGIDGPHTNPGWLFFMFAAMGLPFGLMLLTLGAAKWLRNRRRPTLSSREL